MDRTRKKTYQSLLMPALLPALVFYMLWLAGCQQPSASPGPMTSAADWQARRIEKFEAVVYPGAVAQIRSGDLVTRLGSDITSELFRQMNHDDASFSHCGIASIENDTVFVYHAMGGEFNPDQTLLRQPLRVYAHASENKALGVFRPALSAAQRDSMIGWVQTQFRRGLMFDMKFDYADDSRQYCAEMVAKALSHGAGRHDWLRFSTAGKLQYVAIDNLYRNTLVSEILRYNY